MITYMYITSIGLITCWAVAQTCMLYKPMR